MSRFAQYKRVLILEDLRTLTWGTMVLAGAIGHITAYHDGRYLLVFDRDIPENAGKLIRSDSTYDHTAAAEACCFRWLD